MDRTSLLLIISCSVTMVFFISVWFLYTRRKWFFRKFPCPVVLFPKTGSFNHHVRERAKDGANPFYSLLADKYRVRAFVASRAPGVRLPRIYHVTDHPQDIPFGRLPDSYVVKANNSSGKLIIVRGEIDIVTGRPADREWIIRQCRRWLSRGWSPACLLGERHYRAIEPLIMVEEYLGNESGTPPADYKFYVFHGRPRFLEVHTGRYSRGVHGCNVYDEHFRKMDLLIGDPPSAVRIEKPAEFEAMKEAAARIGEGLDFVRVDLYALHGAVYFGECTLTPAAGFARFVPGEYDEIFGALWDDPAFNPVSDRSPEQERATRRFVFRRSRLKGCDLPGFTLPNEGCPPL